MLSFVSPRRFTSVLSHSPLFKSQVESWPLLGIFHTGLKRYGGADAPAMIASDKTNQQMNIEDKATVDYVHTTEEKDPVQRKQDEQHPKYVSGDYNVNKKRWSSVHCGGHGASAPGPVLLQTSCICLCQPDTHSVTFPANSDKTPIQPVLAHVPGM